MTTKLSDDALRDACAAWQEGRDGGSSPIRAAARVLTGTKHYFEADFITDLERKAAANGATMVRARTLLDALASSPLQDAAGWGQSAGFTSAWVGRGIGSKNAVEDAQITAALESGALMMPLWGLSLDRDVALSYGSAFLFELTGPFPAVPAWAASQIKDHERELITGGRYDVTRLERSSDRIVVGLRFVEVVER